MSPREFGQSDHAIPISRTTLTAATSHEPQEEVRGGVECRMWGRAVRTKRRTSAGSLYVTETAASGSARRIAARTDSSVA